MWNVHFLWFYHHQRWQFYKRNEIEVRIYGRLWFFRLKFFTHDLTPKRRHLKARVGVPKRSGIAFAPGKTVKRQAMENDMASWRLSSSFDNVISLFCLRFSCEWIVQLDFWSTITSTWDELLILYIFFHSILEKNKANKLFQVDEMFRNQNRLEEKRAKIKWRNWVAFYEFSFRLEHIRFGVSASERKRGHYEITVRSNKITRHAIIWFGHCTQFTSIFRSRFIWLSIVGIVFFSVCIDTQIECCAAHSLPSPNETIASFILDGQLQLYFDRRTIFFSSSFFFSSTGEDEANDTVR